jgi:lysophospholipase L1-like esterase
LSVVHTRSSRFAPAALFLAALVACGGSSDPEPAPSPTPTPASIKYVALGDSTGFGVGALPGDGGYPPRLARRLRETGRAVELVNLSVPGANARDIAEAQLGAVAAFAPTLVTVCVGANDADSSTTPEDFGAAIEQILGELAKVPGAAVVLCNVPDVSLTPKYDGDPAVAADVVALNAALTAVATRRGVPVADIYRVSREQLFGNPELISVDGFHPSAAGYEVWAEAMFPVAKAALAIP